MEYEPHPPIHCEQIKKVSVELLATLKKEKLIIENWREKESTRDAVKQGIYDFLFSEKTGLPEGYKEKEIASLTEKLFDHVYRVYKTVEAA